MSDIIFVPFKQLEISPENMRTVNPSKNKDNQLIASVRARGVLQNLIVHRIGNSKKRFGVCAGGRRFSALAFLHDKGEIADDYLVPVRVAKNLKQARDWSLAENSGREQMHPADEFTAFLALAEDGKTVPDIAREYGVYQVDVRRLLKLAVVSPKLIAEFRAGRLDLDAMQAFTLTDDHDKQLAVFDQLTDYDRHARRIRALLTSATVESTDRLARFVGMDAYKKAGGAVTKDLFGDRTYLEDPTLLHQLAAKKLDAEAEPYRAEGWKWVQSDFETYFLSYGDFARFLDPDPASGDAGIRTELDAAEATLEGYAEDDSEAGTAKYEEQEAIVEALQERFDASQTYSEDDKRKSGVLLYIQGDGELAIRCGLMTHDDLKAVKQAQSAETEDGGTARGGDDTPTESQALRDDLANIQLQALQAELCQHSALAQDLLTFSMVDQLLNGEYFGALNLRPQPEEMHRTDDIDSTNAAQMLSKQRAGLATAWMEPAKRDDRFRAFQALTGEEKAALMAYAVAQCLGHSGADLRGTLAKQMDFDLLNYWQPTADTYFRRVKIPQLLKIGSELISPQWGANNAKTKKSELLGQLTEAAETGRWLPEFLAL